MQLIFSDYKQRVNPSTLKSEVGTRHIPNPPAQKTLFIVLWSKPFQAVATEIQSRITLSNPPRECPAHTAGPRHA